MTINPMEELRDSLLYMKRKGDRESVLRVVRAISLILPRSEDVAVSLGKRGPHEYLLDYKGPLLVSTSQEEYLPFLTGNQRRIDFAQLPDEILKILSSKPRELLDQVRDILVEESRRKDMSSTLDQLMQIILEFV